MHVKVYTTAESGFAETLRQFSTAPADCKSIVFVDFMLARGHTEEEDRAAVAEADAILHHAHDVVWANGPLNEQMEMAAKGVGGFELAMVPLPSGRRLARFVFFISLDPADLFGGMTEGVDMLKLVPILLLEFRFGAKLSDLLRPDGLPLRECVSSSSKQQHQHQH